MENMSRGVASKIEDSPPIRELDIKLCTRRPTSYTELWERHKEKARKKKM